ncbi:MAG: hypothetical protein A2163_00865 [Actinobacteria bacterium RBG_13_35_12]|nr:MAG: hypothetical protein A2163_00865 [Actinobacteria bacterium RBG_13_35_12]
MILVTGAYGFIGRYLIEMLLTQGFDVIASGKHIPGKQARRLFDKYNGHFEAREFNVTRANFKSLPDKGISAVVHCAALLRIDVQKYTAFDYFNVNSTGTYNILEYCRKTKVEKIVYIMTHSDINDADSEIIKEDTPRQFKTPYYGDKNYLPFIISKVAGADLVTKFDQDEMVRGIILRLSNIRGYGSKDSKFNCVFHNFIKKAINGEPIEIWGDHTTRRDLIYVKDVCHAIISAIKTPEARFTYNIGTGVGLTIEDEAKAIIEAFSSDQKKSDIIYKPDITEVRTKSCVFDITKAREELAWSPKYTYLEAMKDFKQCMDNNSYE